MCITSAKNFPKTTFSVAWTDSSWPKKIYQGWDFRRMPKSKELTRMIGRKKRKDLWQESISINPRNGGFKVAEKVGPDENKGIPFIIRYHYRENAINNYQSAFFWKNHLVCTKKKSVRMPRSRVARVSELADLLNWERLRFYSFFLSPLL